MIDDEHCYRVAASRDGRFDGLFVTAVLTTGIYCRPSCPARTPARPNVRFYPTPAAAQEAGFRACKRCRPDSAPGSPDWDLRADAVARAVRLIGDGVVEREGVGGLAGRLGYSPRQLHRLMAAEIGTGPLRLAVAHRVQTARSLLEHSGLPVTEVAWAAGFSSIRRFNEAVRSVYGQSPTQIRSGSPAGRPGRPAGAGRAGEPPAPEDGITVLSARLAYRPPMDIGATLGFLGTRAVPGVEEFDGSRYRAAVRLPHGPAVVTVPAEVTTGRRPYVECRVQLSDVRDYPAAVSRLRRLLDLDADPAAVCADLGSDRLLGPLVATRPGLRVPGTMSPDEVAVRAVLGQQVSVAAARAVAGRLAALYGGDLVGGVGGDGGRGGPLRPFPTADALAAADPATFPLPRSRAETLHRLAAALAGGRIDLRPGCDRDRAERELLDLPGIGPWTAAYIRMRALGDPDVYLPGDRALERAAGPARSEGGADRWKPWRSYAVVHLWGSLSGPPATRPMCTRSRSRSLGGTMTTTELLPAAQRSGPASWDELTLRFPDRDMTVLIAADEDGAVTGLRFGSASDHARWIGPARRDPAPVADASDQLRRYAAGELESFDLRLRLAGSDFQLAVWSELLRIPFGGTTTYGSLAESIGRPGRARPVGTAVGSNPIGIIVPCHRVLGAGGSLTGFAGGLDNKATLLAREGVTAF